MGALDLALLQPWLKPWLALQVQGRASLDRVPYVVDVAVKAMAGTKQLLLCGARKPVTFFAYPNKPQSSIPDDAQIYTLARTDQDIVEALARLCDVLKCPKVAAPNNGERTQLAKGALTPENVSAVLGALVFGATTRVSMGLSVLYRRQLLKSLVELQYKRNDAAFGRGTFRVRGDSVEIFPAHYEDRAWRVNLFGDEVESIHEFDPLTGQKTDELEFVKIYANSHYVTPRPTLIQAIQGIKAELKWRLDQLHDAGRLLEAQRLEQRTLFDLEMLEATGVCAGIENYSRYLTGRKPGEPPPTLFEYVPDRALIFCDESHVTVPQLGGMYRGDFRRKATLAEYGFRLPSCLDNRPLRFEEWDAMRPQSIHVSATPAKWELEQTGGVFAEQVIRPTGLIDPPVEVRPVSKDGASQVDDVVDEIRQTIKKGYRTLVTVLTKKMAEDLTEYLNEQGIRVRYMHSDVDTLERIEIIRDLRLGAFDVLIGINLLREGLDIPECALVAILDADKEGFLRSRTSLIQTIGRAARNVDGRVILYADKMTDSLKAAIEETNRRRTKQSEWNEAHGLDWWLTDAPPHRGLQLLVKQLNTSKYLYSAKTGIGSDAAPY